MTGTELKQRLAAILAADVAGYSRLMASDERATVAALDAARAVFRTQIESNLGRVIDMAGDSVLAVFETATGAVSAALAVQQELNASSSTVPEDRRMCFRIGVHLGDIIAKSDGTVYGDGVNIAARLQALAEIGGIMISDAVHGAVRGKVTASFVDQGEQQVKNIPHPVRAYQVNLTVKDGLKIEPLNQNKQDKKSKRGAFRSAVISLAILAVLAIVFFAWRDDIIPSHRPTVLPYSAQDLRMSFAVLPISAPDGDKTAATFANAVTEAFIDRQTNSPWARVVSRESVGDALKKHTSAKELGRALNVHFLLRGNVTRAGDTYNVTASIIDAEPDRILGTREFSWPAGKAVHGYSSQINKTVGALAYMGFQVELARTKQKKREDLDVRDLAYLANDAWHNDKASYDIAMPLLQRALSLAPDDRLALMLVVRVNLCECRNSWSKDPQEQENIGADAFERYLAKYPNDRAMTMQKMNLYELHGRFEDSLVLVDHLLEKTPEDPELLGAKAFDLVKLGRSNEALAVIEDSMRQDWSGDLRTLAAEVHYMLGHNAEAADLARKAAAEMSKVELAHPASGGVRLIQVAAEANLGHTQQAKAALADFTAAVPDARTISAVKKWMGPHADLAGYEPFYEGLRKAGLQD